MHTCNLILALGLAGLSQAFFRMPCLGRVVRERSDPIVSPGTISGHVHTISGGAGFSASMTFQDARASQCSSCSIKEDMSNYWTPQLYVKFKNGTFSPVPVMGDPDDVRGGMTVYYLQRRGNDGNEKLYAFPEGFRMVAGNPFKRSFDNDLASKAITFNCLGSGKPETNSMPNYNCPSGLRAQVFFPACWNGKDLDSADHKSHMSYPSGSEYNTGGCPADYPVHMISIFYEVLYDTNPFLDQWDGDQHPFVFATGDATGYGFHGDFLNGWDVDVLQNAVDNCTNDSGQVEKCSAVTLFSTQENIACHIPTTINEQVDGNLDKLPGYNPVTYGPDRAQPGSYSAPQKRSPGFRNYVDVTQTKQWKYIGCGTDSASDRAFAGTSTTRNNMTVESCIDFCSSADFTYAGLEYGSECFCADQLNPTYAPKDSIVGSCTMKCSANGDQICGGANAMSLYQKCVDEQCKNIEIGRNALVQRAFVPSSIAVSTMLSSTPPSLAAESPSTSTSTPTFATSFFTSTLVTTLITTSSSSAVAST